MDSQIQITLAANAGLLLRYRDTSVLLDALFSERNGSFLEPSLPTQQKLMDGAPPFEGVDYVMFTHLHADHFSEKLTREYLHRHPVKGLLLPCSDRQEQPGFPDFVNDTGTPCYMLTSHTHQAVFRLSPDVQVTALRTPHLDAKYHDVPHFCFLISCGEKRLLFTSDADYTVERFAILENTPLRAAFVNPLFFCDLQRRRFFRGSLPAETIVVYHLPFSETDGPSLQGMFSRCLQTWPEKGPGVYVLDRELDTILL